MGNCCWPDRNKISVWSMGWCKQETEVNNCSGRIGENPYSDSLTVYASNEGLLNHTDDFMAEAGANFHQLMKEVTDRYFSHQRGSLTEIAEVFTKAKPKEIKHGGLLQALLDIVDALLKVVAPEIEGSASTIRGLYQKLYDSIFAQGSNVDPAATVIEWVTSMRDSAYDHQDEINNDIVEADTKYKLYLERLNYQSARQLKISVYKFYVALLKSLGAYADMREAVIRQYFKASGTVMKPTDFENDGGGGLRQLYVTDISATDPVFVVKMLIDWHGGCVDMTRYLPNSKGVYRLMEAKYTGSSVGNVCQEEEKSRRCTTHGCIYAAEGCCDIHGGSHGTLRCGRRRRNRCGAASADDADELVV